MANLNWERVAARYRLAIGEGAGEDALFLPFGAPVQVEARISAEELKAALDDHDDRRPLLLDLCLPADLPRRSTRRSRGSAAAPRRDQERGARRHSLGDWKGEPVPAGHREV